MGGGGDGGGSDLSANYVELVVCTLLCTLVPTFKEVQIVTEIQYVKLGHYYS